MLSTLRHMLPDEGGATLVEYSLIVLLIATATIAATTRVGQAVVTILNTTVNAFS
jgi:Flp pilus assembly pilin Flp